MIVLQLIIFKNGNPLIATLAKEKKPVVPVKVDIACSAKSEVIASYGMFGLTRESDARKNQGFDLSINLHNFQAFGRD